MLFVAYQCPLWPIMKGKIMKRMFRVRKDPLKAQGFRTQRTEEPEDLWQPLYDRVNVTTAVPGSVAFFANARGQTATLITGTAAAASKTKTYRDTNMENSNVVPTKMFKFIGLSVGIVHRTKTAITNAADRELVMEGGYVQFRIVDKDILFLPLIAIPLINPISAMATTVTATSAIATNPGGGEGIAMYRFQIPITLNPYENFTVQFVYDGSITLSNSLDMYCILQGFQRRPT